MGTTDVCIPPNKGKLIELLIKEWQVKSQYEDGGDNRGERHSKIISIGQKLRTNFLMSFSTSQ